jgi:hypothetical protein
MAARIYHTKRAMLARASRTSFETARRSASAALARPPCRYPPLHLPVGAPPRAPWHRHTMQPRTAGARHGRRVRFEVAEQRGAACARFFLSCVGDDGLPAFDGIPG